MIDTGDGEQSVNVRVYTDGLSKDHKQSWISWIVAVVTMTIYTGWIQILGGLFIASWFNKWAAVIFWGLMATLWLPPRPVLWKAFNRLWVFKTWREYFRYSYLNEAVLDPKKKYIFVEFPHGVYPMSELIAGALCQTIWPFFDIYSVAADSVFKIPFWRHFIAWLGAVPAGAKNFKRVLAKGNVAVIVGGIAEMYMQHPRKERIKLQGRKGFVRIAVEEGLNGGIIPVYHFGNTALFDFVPQSLEAVARKYRFALGYLIGRWGLPLARPVPLYMVSGVPIPVKKVPKDSPDFEKEVDRVHAQVVAALQDLYDRHKASYGWADRPLVIE